ncbi:hypothetical protein [Streptomyces mexicanus]|uniref:hypothetical protein n=1 Tax=Streptomyces mexicanus TaxID=178566 RepID=UPI00365018EF
MLGIPDWLPVALFAAVMGGSVVYTVYRLSPAGRWLRLFVHRRLVGMPVEDLLPPYEPDPELEARVVREQSVVRTAELIVAAEYARTITEK